MTTSRHTVQYEYTNTATCVAYTVFIYTLVVHCKIYVFAVLNKTCFTRKYHFSKVNPTLSSVFAKAF